MLKRHLGWFLAPAGLLSVAVLTLGLAAPSRAGDDSAPPLPETVKILDASQAGDLSVTVRGQGEDRVRFTVKNKSKKRLNVIIPPGLVASAGLGQGGGFQSMGLGVPTDSPGAFGAFRPTTSSPGFQSMPVAPEGLAVSPGQTVEFFVPSVCLNYGIATPTPKNVFRLMDVDDYTPDARVRKALRSLSTIGTSQGVAQAVMWHVANGMTLEQLASNGAKYLNSFELAQAARFVQALDGSGASDLVEPAYFQQDRVLVRIVGEGLQAKDAKRLSEELYGARILGLPARVVGNEEPLNRPGTILLNVVLSSSKAGQTAARVNLRHASAFGSWDYLGVADIREAMALSDMRARRLLWLSTARWLARL